MNKIEHAGFTLMIDSVWQQVQARRPGRDLKRLDVLAVADLIRDYITMKTRDDDGRGRIAWPHLGVFKIRRRKARNIRNPNTRELMLLPEGWQLVFVAAKNQKGVLGAR